MKSDKELRRKHVWIIVLNWNGRELLEECLSSIKEKTEYPYFHVLVIDNGSTDGSIEMIKNHFPWVELITNKRNVGLVKARNQGIKFVFNRKADFILFLDNDTKIIQREWLTRMIEFADHNCKIGIVGCKLVFPDMRIQHAGAYVDITGGGHYGLWEANHTKYREVKEVDYVCGATFLIKRGVIDKIGLFDELFSPTYFEEADYCIRARKAGFKVVYYPEVTIVHRVGATVGKHSKMFHRVYRVNSVRFQLLNFPLKWLVVGAVLAIAKGILKKRKKKRSYIPSFGLRKDWTEILLLVLKEYMKVFIQLPEIISKRKNRVAKLWY